MTGRSIVLTLVFTVALVPAASAQVEFERPGVITSAGQSADAAIVKVMLNTQFSLGLAYKPLAQAADLAGMKTMIVSVGASPEGLAAAGSDMSKEIARTTALVKAAKAAGVRILVMHTGGAARRGKTTDDLIQVLMPAADYVVVVAAGNKDKLFNKLAAKQNTPLMEVAKIAESGNAVRAVFKQ